MPLSLIAAIADNGCIGNHNQLPWNIPEDLKRFRSLTKNHPVIMGRKTFESIVAKIGRPLPDRTNIILTRQADYAAPVGVFVYTSLDKILKDYQNQAIWSIGGGEIYKETLPFADSLYLTEVHQTVDGDTFFPPFDRNLWCEATREDKTGYSFVMYKKILPVRQ